VRENPRVGLLESYYPDGGMIFAVTAVLRFDVDEAPRRGEEALFDDFISTEGQRSAVLSFLNPVSRPTIKIADSAIPLALDTTAPLALQVARSKQLRQASGVGFRDAEEVADLHGLYMHGPYDPQKIPVLMIHGLRSSPLAWLEMTNDLDGDRELRSAYQLWHYFYPTGLPYLYNAATLRQQLNELRRLDPNDTHAALDSMVIVAHSMGGLVSKPLVSSSEKRIWDRFFTVGPEQIVGSPEDVARLVAMTIFEPFAAIDRVIFISTPHRGSPMVNGFIGRLGSNVIRLPEDYSDLFYRLSEANLAVIRPEARKQMTRGGSTSIKALSPQHVALQGLSELPFDPQVKLHTIIGDRDQATGSDTDSDGFVTHESAFLAEAVSELFVPGGHSAYAHPLTILEVKRILKEHLRERSAAADSSR
jgi:pimeloyl-ACP methyl ester carboxylesterase